MKVLAKCPQCKKMTEFGADAPDKRLRCAWCGRRFKVPALGEMEDAARIINTDGGAIYIDEDGKVYG